MAQISIARLKIVLDDVDPPVMRRIEVPLDLRLDRLHAVLQEAVGWTNSHLWEFRVRDIGFGIPDPEWGFGNGPIDARKTTLLAVIEDTGAKSFRYLYDFGDGWKHSIRIERIEPALADVVYPACWRRRAAARPKMSVDPGVTRNSSKRSPTPSTSGTGRWSNGRATASITATSTSMQSVPNCSGSARAGPANRGPGPAEHLNRPDHPVRANRARNSASAWRSPSSVSTTDLALLAGSAIIPFRCRRFIASQSKLFQARRSS